MRLSLFLSLPVIASAFIGRAPAPMTRKNVMKMAITDDLKFDAKLATLEVEKGGVSAPFGFFDPLNFYGGKTTRQKKKLREAELKHCRVSMLAFLGILVQENFHPLLAGDDIGIAVDHYYQIEDIIPDFWLGIMFILSLYEARSISNGWDPISETLSNPKIAGLRDDYVSGNNSYDPLALCPDDEESFIKMRTRELNNGRLSMIAVIGVIGQELATGKPIFAHLFG